MSFFVPPVYKKRICNECMYIVLRHWHGKVAGSIVSRADAAVLNIAPLDSMHNWLGLVPAVGFVYA